MTIDYLHLKSRAFPEVHRTYEVRDMMLYALSLGLGRDPLDAQAAPYVYEGAPGGLQALPSLAVVLGYPGFSAREPDSGIDWVNMLHGEQRMTVHTPLPASAPMVGRNRVTHITDKGTGKGAIVVVERRLEDPAGSLYATLQQVLFCRSDGGYSQAGGGQPSDEALPSQVAPPTDRLADAVEVHPIRPEAALLYRLMGDPNPLHADPVVARAAGFERPILHGLASYVMACWAVVRHFRGGDGSRLRTLAVRFTSPVYPGETLQTEMWRDGSVVRFQSRVQERDRIVMSHGHAVVA